MPAAMNSSGLHSPRLTQLDGVRALLALWVLFGHVSLFMGCNVPLLNNPAIAVDLFMVLSGLFIANTFDGLWRQNDGVRAAQYFWTRRVLRIWPLYAVILTVCWLNIEQLNVWMQRIAAAFPRATQGAELYVTPTYVAPTFSDAMLHYSMLFGVLPTHATSTPLPDWSLSLEFQFYLLYPLLFLVARSRLLLLCGAAACLAYVSPALFGFYLQPGKLAHFDQPSFLPYKLNLFLVGVLINAWLQQSQPAANQKVQARYSEAMLIVAMIVCLAVSGFLTTLGVALILYLIVRPQTRLANWLSLPLPRFYGDISYTIYLVHRPLLLMIGGVLSANPRFVAQSGAVRIMLVSALLLLLTTLISWLLNVVVERPGNNLARRLTARKADAVNEHLLSEHSSANPYATELSTSKK